MKFIFGDFNKPGNNLRLRANSGANCDLYDVFTRLWLYNSAVQPTKGRVKYYDGRNELFQLP